MGRNYTSKGRPTLQPITLDGVEFVPQGDANMLELVELASHGGLSFSDVEGAKAIGSFLRAVFGGEVYEAFREHCRTHATDDATIETILEDIITEVTARPTQRPSPSGVGPQTTGITSSAPSPSPETPTEVVLSDRLGTVTVLPLTAEREAELRAQSAVAQTVEELGGEVQAAPLAG